MATVTQCQAWEVRLVDEVANHHKFYRVYVVGPWSVFQWGPIGGRGGFKVMQHGSDGLAREAVLEQLWAKRGKGYENHSEASFTVPTSILTDLAANAAVIDVLYRNHAAGADGTDEELSPRIKDREAKQEAKLKDGLLALTRRFQGTGATPQLAQEGTEAGDPPDESPIAARLRAAVEAAQAKNPS